MILARIEQIRAVPTPVFPYQVVAPPEDPRAGTIVDLMLGFVAIAYDYDADADRVTCLALQLLEGP